ncbi:MAG: replicative DNA helicase [SAR324 cluster bacterium]|nr:replicative DNA helicase [SAR324 cluster bacterium]MBF0352816.1 replicative DNA helicase [SAR324 cluster bacterium]
MSSTKIEKLDELLPNDKLAEQAVLGAIIIKNDLYPVISDVLEASDFFSPAHRHLYEAMRELFEKNSPIDELILHQLLTDTNKITQSGGVEYLATLAQTAPVPDNAIHYARIVAEKSQLRNIIVTANDIARQGREGNINIPGFILEATEKLKAIESRTKSRNYEHLKTILLRNFELLEQLSQNHDTVTGLPTGFTDLDELTRGLQAGNLVIIAARPSMGKTAFAMNIAYFASHARQLPVVVFSLEMPKEHLAMRLLCSEAKINSKKLWSGNLDSEDWEKLLQATSVMAETPLIIDDQAAITPNHIRQVARQIHQDHKGLGLIVVDYLQLMQASRKVNSREQEVSEISRNLKAIAKEFNVPVIALSQLNRDLERRPNKRPMMADLRESGAIEQDADVILFIYRDEVYNENTADQGIGEIIVAKNRNGELGHPIRLAFIGQYTKFANLSLQDTP